LHDPRKDMKTIVGIAQRYAEENDMEENKARIAYETMFDLSCSLAEKEKRDLWEYLSTSFKIPEEKRYLIKPPDTLKNKKKRQDYIKGQFLPLYYEWLINHVLFPTTNELKEFLLGKSGGGKKTVATTKPRSAARKAPIIKERKKLIDNGVTDERVILKRIRKIFPNERSSYIQQTILVERYKEAGKRRLARTGF